MALKDVFDKIRGRLPSDFLFVGERLTMATAQTMIDKAPTRRIKGAIEVKPTVQQGETVIGKIEIKLNEEAGGAPEAMAYEYGSGIHSEKGEAYVILPREKRALAFFWDKANASIPRLPDGRVLLQKVNHPGVAAKPYIEPSLEELRKTVKGIISVQVKKSLSAAFGEANKE